MCGYSQVQKCFQVLAKGGYRERLSLLIYCNSEDVHVEKMRIITSELAHLVFIQEMRLQMLISELRLLVLL